MSVTREQSLKSMSRGRAVLVVCTVAFAMAFIGAWVRPVWHDELYTLALARLPVNELLAALVVDSGPPLHYVLSHLLFVLVGWPEGSLLGTVIVRLPSVIAFALIPWVVWRARPAGQRGFLWGPILVVTWLPMLYFGTEARAYGVLALVNALLWIQGPEWIERGGRRTTIFAALAASLSLLHYTGFVSFLALPALAGFVSHRRRRVLWAALVGSALPFVAWLPVVLNSPHESMAWVEMTSGPGRPGVATLSVLSPAGPFPALFEMPSMPVAPWVSMSLFGVLLGGAVFGLVELLKNVDTSACDLSIASRLAIGLLPALAVALLARGGVPVYFAGRTESMVWPLIAALVALLAFGLPVYARWIVVGSYVVVGGLTLAVWLSALPARPPAPGVEVGHFLASVVEDGDRVVIAGLWELEVRHGLAAGESERPSASSPKVEVETFPHSQALHPGWLDRDALMSPNLLQEAWALRESAGEKHNRIWLVWSPALPLESNFFPAFAGWRRDRKAASAIIMVDLLVPPLRETPFAVDEERAP
jgi:hypothetical protein